MTVASKNRFALLSDDFSNEETVKEIDSKPQSVDPTVSSQDPKKSTRPRRNENDEPQTNSKDTRASKQRHNSYNGTRKREFDRKSGKPRTASEKKESVGKQSWGSPTDE